jgi:hypothetical protein
VLWGGELPEEPFYMNPTLLTTKEKEIEMTASLLVAEIATGRTVLPTVNVNHAARTTLCRLQ